VADRALRQQREESDRRQRRLLGVIGVGSVLLAAMAATTLYALSQRSEAQDQAREATAHQLEALSAASLPVDPERSLVFAREAARLAPTGTAEEALRSALLASRVRTVVAVGEPLLGAAMRRADILAATESGSLVVANGATGEILRTIETSGRARRVSFADDGTALFTGQDGTLDLVGADGTVRKIAGAAGVQRAEISPDGSLAALLDGTGGRLVDVETGGVERTFLQRGIVSAAISPDNRWIATGAADDTIRVWARTGALLRRLDQKGHPTALTFTNAATSLASAGTDGLARIWQSGTGQLSTVLEGDATGLTDVGFSTDGAHIVTTSEDGTVRVSNADVGATLVTLNGHRERVTSAAFTGPAGSMVVTASTDGTARVWDALFQPELEEIARFPSPVSAIEVEGARLRVTTADGRLHVLEADTGEEIAVAAGGERERVASGPDGATARIRLNTVVLRADGERTLLEGHRDRVRSVEFSPDGTLLASASRDQSVRVWDGDTGEALVALQHNSEVRDASFSPDGRWVVTAAFRAALWDPRSGLNVVRLQGHNGPVTAATFDSSGRRIVTGGVDGTVRTYACVICGELDELVALADERLAATGRALTEEERERYLG
jgi:WD40 repeat protein